MIDPYMYACVLFFVSINFNYSMYYFSVWNIVGRYTFVVLSIDLWNKSNKSFDKNVNIEKDKCRMR